MSCLKREAVYLCCLLTSTVMKHLWERVIFPSLSLLIPSLLFGFLGWLIWGHCVALSCGFLSTLSQVRFEMRAQAQVRLLES